MARQRSSGAEISLFPFLSILVCLIGALVLLIVILTLAQGAAGDGRPPEDMQRALEAQKIDRNIAAALAERERLRREMDKLLAAGAGAQEQEERVLQLRKDFSELAKVKDPKLTSAELQKRLENILTQIAEMAKEKPPLVAELEKLKAELAKRKKNPDDKPPPVIVQPGGSGQAGAAALFFVEAGGAGISLHDGRVEPPRVSSASIGTDDAYNQFLAKAKKSPNSLVIFLVRPDGADAYSLAAGWAENQFKLRTGKLPLPGQGPVDLSQFGLRKAR